MIVVIPFELIFNEPIVMQISIYEYSSPFLAPEIVAPPSGELTKSSWIAPSLRLYLFCWAAILYPLSRPATRTPLRVLSPP